MRELTEIGCYIYFIGMNVVMFALMNFAASYCRTGNTIKNRAPVILYVALAAGHCDSGKRYISRFFQPSKSLILVTAWYSYNIQK